ncbi:hypothetical protein CJC78_22635 [Escherichia coli]|nr:hypothetical protein [Escherichia coli]
MNILFRIKNHSTPQKKSKDIKNNKQNRIINYKTQKKQHGIYEKKNHRKNNKKRIKKIEIYIVFKRAK